LRELGLAGAMPLLAAVALGRAFVCADVPVTRVVESALLMDEGMHAPWLI
jgi:hypothetical protein